MPFCYDLDMTMTKICSKCLVEKSLDDFYKGTGTHGVKAACKPCHNAYCTTRQATPEGKIRLHAKKLKYRYGITQDQYDWLSEQQGHKCFLCGESERVPHHKTGELMRLAVDHDHRCCPGNKKACGECVRGLLCYNCNRFMGQVDNSPRLSQRFRDYQDRRPLRDYISPELEAELVKEAEAGYDLGKLTPRPIDEAFAEWSDVAMSVIYEENWLND